MKKVFLKFSLLVFVFIISLFALELSLRAGGFLYLLPKSEIFGINEDKKVYTILALGESTTAESTWPKQLEEVLNEKSEKNRFRVINGGMPGTTTVFILSRLEDNLDKYKPDMVITMMGINDDNSYLYYSDIEDEASGGLSGFLEKEASNLRIAKMARWIIFSVKEGSFDTFNLKSFDNSSLTASGQKEAVDYIEKAIREYLGNDYESAENYYRKALELDPKNEKSYYVAFGWLIDNKQCFSMADNKIRKRFEQISSENADLQIDLDDDGAINGLVSLYKNKLYLDDRNLAEVERLVGRVLGSKEVLGVSVEARPGKSTAYHYRQLHKVLESRGIKYVAMQYPTLPIQSLKDILKDESDIIFVSNEDNFNQKLEKEGYDKLFVDKFAKTFGHTTKLGDKLIAESAAKEILRYFDTLPESTNL